MPATTHSTSGVGAALVGMQPRPATYTNPTPLLTLARPSSPSARAGPRASFAVCSRRNRPLALAATLGSCPLEQGTTAAAVRPHPRPCPLAQGAAVLAAATASSRWASPACFMLQFLTQSTRVLTAERMQAACTASPRLAHQRASYLEARRRFPEFEARRSGPTQPGLPLASWSSAGWWSPPEEPMGARGSPPLPELLGAAVASTALLGAAVPTPATPLGATPTPFAACCSHSAMAVHWWEVNGERGGWVHGGAREAGRGKVG
ncbi:hypothetical protein SETIT_9G220400v2 [Setaria italica]|uniref:Uncharacterized protein n=1 Tax=Setaria italica TaxID=4555 RepID=K4ADX9_SETIT|nr:hypothetical protein SETIT_9G220400v2 [Setaria italica]